MAKKTTPSTSLRSSIDSFRVANRKQPKAPDQRTLEIAGRLRKLREDRSMFLYEVAKKLKPPVWPQTIHKWESGQLRLPLERLRELAAIYGVKVEEVLGG